MSTPGATSYDTLPYDSIAFPQSHPDHLHVIARLFGMRPASPSRCRVLEIGCASGGNLIPIATQAPESTFVGIDLSARQIADGKAMLADLDIRNVDLRHMDLADVDESFGEFDYVIAHGVYSWIPSPVQEKLLGVCKHNLAPQGVAFVSYNTYPGWHMRSMVRDMMIYHTRQFPDMALRVQQARALLDFLSANVPTENSPYGMMLKVEVEILRNSTDSYLAHEHLEDINAPVYFHEFIERAGLRGLQYLGEADFHTMLASNFPAQVAETLRSVAPTIAQMEQYMDFVRNRVFRQTLLVHQSVALNRNVVWRDVLPFHASARLQPETRPVDLDGATFAKFKRPGDSGGINTAQPIVKAAMLILGELWPRTMPVEELCRAARGRLAGGLAAASSETLADDRERVCRDLLGCFAAGILELRAEPAALSTVVGDRPRADRIARYLASRGRPFANRRHETLVLDELSRRVVLLLDGEHDHRAIVDAVAKIAVEGGLRIEKDKQQITDPALIRAALDGILPECYERIARYGLLEA
ncbi:MAG TPA: class I SAM-dependent methyltransferase [Casimicrobiaceae bacterium]|nr:class I SAM-dependent methyltransferase [Casimicrobiaceae bacterium]